MSRRHQKNAKITLSILFIFIGIGLLLFNYWGAKKSDLFSEKNMKLVEQQIVLPEEVRMLDEDDLDEPTITDPVEDAAGYIGYLSVPDVNIKRGFTTLDSPNNTLSKNIMLIQGSNMPDVDKGNLILAGHNGRSRVSFFNDLYKLNMGTHAYVTYNGKIYDYVLKDRYDVPKVGNISIKRNVDKTTLTLITCHRTSNSLQVVFVFELENINKIQ